MKRVLQISKYYYPFFGGTEQVARDIARALSKQGAEQKIICFNEDAKNGNISCHHRETVHDIIDGVDVIRCGYIAKISSQAISLAYVKEMKEVMDGFKPEIVILHYPNPYVTHFLLQYKDRDFRLLVYWHLDITKQKILKHLFNGQNFALIKRADKILGATPRHVDESSYSKEFGDKKHILPYMIEESKLSLSKEELNRAAEIKDKFKGKKLGFFIGRHVPYKGLQYLIEASKLMGDAPIHFIVAGTGELTEKLKTQAIGDDKVEFVGKISDSERCAYLYACDIVCFPSITRNEGFGLALAEGMYFGHPAVTFTISGSGVNYVNIDGVTGIECPNCDSRAYADALLKLTQDDTLRKKYGDNARKRVLENFTESRFNENIKRLIAEL